MASSASVAGTRAGSTASMHAGAAAAASAAHAAGQPTPGSISIAVSALDDVPTGRYKPLMVPSAQKVICSKQNVLDRSVVYSSLPASYSRNSTKESTLLEYVEDFRRQFVHVFPTRRPLTLCPRNECGVRKFLPSTIRPTQLPYNDAYDLRELADFVADYLTFLPLDEPTKLPDLVAATATMLQVRKGDALDHAIMLVSLLRGSGYNAYVVLGYAPQPVTEMDQSEEVCPLLPDQAEVARKEKEEAERKAEEEKTINKYAILQKPAHTSRYRQARIQEAADIAAKVIADEEARVRKLKERAADPLHGQRAHAWVLVSRGRRDITEELFVEATTGVIHPVASGSSPYMAVDAVFNEQNMWVNVQTHLDGSMRPIKEINWDLSNGKDWEYVLIDERRYRDSLLQRGGTQSTGAGGASQGGAASAAAAAAVAAMNFESVNASEDASSSDGPGGRPRELAPEDTFDDRSVLDTPPSWTAPIVIRREDYQARYPGGHKFTQYKDCTVEKWSPYYRGRVGCIRRVKVFQENRTLEVRDPLLIEVWESFAHRKDKLVERRHYPLEGKTVAHYAAGLLTGLKSYSWVDEQTKSFTFYPGARVDGLIGREERHHLKVVETYSGRDDFLVYRSIAVDTRPLGSRGQKVVFLPLGTKSIEFPIRKLTEKYARNPSVPAEADIAKRTHFLTNNTIRLDFHLADHHITHSTHLLDKADKLELAETEGRQVGSVGSLLRVDPYWQERSRGEEQQMVAKLLLVEKELKLKLKAREESWIKETIKLDEELDDSAGKILLEKSIYDVAFEDAQRELAQMSLAGSGGQDPTAAELEAQRLADKNKVDYLTPFLSQYSAAVISGAQRLNRRQAQQVKDECLAALKERLLERAHIIQQHLDEETAKLHQRQSLFKRQAGSGAVEASEEFNRFSNACLFRIDILNARRARHEELALKKYVELDERLNNDPRLAALHEP